MGEKQKRLIAWLRQELYLSSWSNTNHPCLQIVTNKYLIYYEACDASFSYVKHLCVSLP